MPFDIARAKAQHRHMLAYLPTVVVIGGVNYTGTKTSVRLDRLFLDEGRLSQYEFSVQLSQYDFRKTTQPAIDSLVVISGTTYRILGATKDAADIALVLHLGAQYANG